MSLPSLREALKAADQERTAVGHFNFSETVVLRAVAAAARDLRAPLLVGVSEGEREFLGVRQAAALVKSFRDEWGIAIFLNADHTHSLDKAVEAAKAGFDMVVFDASAQCFEENVKQTRAAVEAMKSIHPGIIVEGEIGYIGTSSEIHTGVPAGMSPHSTPEEARQFVEATRVDVLAPAVGTMHGMLPSMASGEEHKHLDIRRIAEIKSASGVFLTLHGGSWDGHRGDCGRDPGGPDGRAHQYGAARGVAPRFGRRARATPGGSCAVSSASRRVCVHQPDRAAVDADVPAQRKGCGLGR